MCNYQISTPIPALGHARTESVTAEPTCAANGFKTVSCSRCSATLENTPIPPLGHVRVDNVTKQPTCTENGMRTVSCSRCFAALDGATIPALGHDYHITIDPAPTCTATGLEVTTCSRCGEIRTNGIAALGHDLRTAVTKAATCTEEGVQTTSCTRCTYKTTRPVSALGHDHEVTVTEPTCEQAGSKVSLCSRCGDEEEEAIDPLGHDYSAFEIITAPSCEEDGLQKATCDRCGEDLEEVIPQTGHFYPEEWTVEQEAGYFSEGMESKTCTTCLAHLEQTIPKKSKVPIAAGAGGVLLLGGGASGFLWKRKRILPELAEPVPEQAQEQGYTEMKRSGASVLSAAIAAMFASAGAGAAKAVNGLQKPSLETKSLVVCSENAALLKLFRSKRFLKDTVCTPENLIETVKEKEPDLVICSIGSTEQLDDVIAAKKGACNDYTFGLVVDQEVLDANKARLDSLVKEKTVSNYISSSFNENTVLVKLVAPLLKPDPKSDNTLEGIGIVADMLGIPGISTVIEVFSSGKDIKEAVQKGKLNLSDQTTIISDLAGILGFDTAADVLELLTDVREVNDNTKEQD